METTILLFDAEHCKNLIDMVETNLQKIPRTGEYLTYKNKDYLVCKVSYLILEKQDPDEESPHEQIVKIVAYQIANEPARNPNINQDEAIQ